MKRTFGVWAGLWLAVVSLSAQGVSFTGAALSENFDSMSTNGTVTPSGWFAGALGAGSGGNGALSKPTLYAGDGSITLITNWNVGTSNSVERALGSQAG